MRKTVVRDLPVEYSVDLGELYPCDDGFCVVPKIQAWAAHNEADTVPVIFAYLCPAATCESMDEQFCCLSVSRRASAPRAPISKMLMEFSPAGGYGSSSGSVGPSGRVIQLHEWCPRSMTPSASPLKPQIAIAPSFSGETAMSVMDFFSAQESRWNGRTRSSGRGPFSQRASSVVRPSFSW